MNHLIKRFQCTFATANNDILISETFIRKRVGKQTCLFLVGGVGGSRVGRDGVGRGEA